MAVDLDYVLGGLKLLQDRVRALDYVPPVYMWMVTFADGQALAQWDPITGKQNKFPHNRKDIIKAGWFPIGPVMGDRILEAEGIITRCEDYSSYEIDIPAGARPYLRHTTIVPPGQYHECLVCGAKWIFAKGKPNLNITRQGFPRSAALKIYCTTCARSGKNVELTPYDTPWGEQWKCTVDHGHKPMRYQLAVCPSCGYHNLPTDTKDELKIVQKVTDMSYLIYKLGVEGGPVRIIDQWGELVSDV